MARDLSGALIAEQVAEIAAALPAVASSDAQVGAAASPTRKTGCSAAAGADAAGRRRPRHRAMGASTTTSRPALAPTRCRQRLPLPAAEGADAHCAACWRSSRASRRWLLVPEQRRLLETFAALIAIALERVHYVDVAQSATVQMESERLRNSLLAAHLARPAHAAGGAGRAWPIRWR